MATPSINLPTQTLTTSAQTSTGLPGLDYTVAIGVMTLSTITSTTGIIVQIEPTSTGTNFANLLSGGNVVYVTSGNAIVINPFPFKQIRFASSVTEQTAVTLLLNATIPV